MLKILTALLMTAGSAEAATQSIGFALGAEQGWVQWTFDDTDPRNTVAVSDIDLTFAGKTFLASDVGITLHPFSLAEFSIGGIYDGSYTNQLLGTNVDFVIFVGTPFETAPTLLSVDSIPYRRPPGLVPLPATLPLLATAIGFLAWRKYRD